jgi:hypothetical protein
LLVWLLFAALVPGCTVEDPSERPVVRVGRRLVPARGRITLDGKPLPRVVVVFMPVSSDSGTHSIAETRDDGTFELSHLYQTGTAPGDYRVMVTRLVGPTGKPVDLEERSADRKSYDYNNAKELVPKRYSDYSQTELRATVREGGPPLAFDLEGPLLGPLPTPGEKKPAAGERPSEEGVHPAPDTKGALTPSENKAPPATEKAEADAKTPK